MGSTAYAAYQNGAAKAGSAHTVTAMGRWSVVNKQLPAADKVKAIHVYDFDNTRETLVPMAALPFALVATAAVPAAVFSWLLMLTHARALALSPSPQCSRPRSRIPSSGMARQ